MAPFYLSTTYKTMQCKGCNYLMTPIRGGGPQDYCASCLSQRTKPKRKLCKVTRRMTLILQAYEGEELAQALEKILRDGGSRSLLSKMIKALREQ